MRPDTPDMPGDAAPPDDFFAAPPFRPAEGLQRLRRELRELGLAEHGGVFERRGQPVARLEVSGERLVAAMVREPGSHARAPGASDWQVRHVADGAQLRDFVAELKRRLARWSERDD